MFTNFSISSISFHGRKKDGKKERKEVEISGGYG
jgi:hypothetical protein